MGQRPHEPTRLPGQGWLPSGRVKRATVIIWLALIAMWAQFAVASCQELETQAATLGGIVVGILLVGGITVLAVNNQQSHRGR